MDLADYLRLLRRRGMWTVATLTITVAAAIAWVGYGPTTYASSQALLLAGSGQDSTSAEARLNSYAELLRDPRVINAVHHQLGRREPADDLSRRLSSEVKANTLILTVTAEDSSADGASALVTSASDQLVTLTSSLAGTGGPDGRLATTDAATPAVPTGNGPRTIAWSVLLGLLLGVVLALLREATDARIHSTDQVRKLGAADVPVVQLRCLPRIVADGDVPPGVHVLRAVLLHQARQGPATYVISSCDGRYPFGEIASSLALALARATVSVVLVSADLRPGRRTEVNDAVATPGLGEALTTGSAVQTLICPSTHPRLWVIQQGRVVSHPEDALASNLMTGVVDSLRQAYGTVLIHTPPLDTGTEALAVAEAGRAAVVLTLAQGQTRRRQVRAALAALDSARVPVAAMVLVPPRRQRPAPRRAGDQKAPPAMSAASAVSAAPAAPGAASPSPDGASAPARSNPQARKG